MWLYGWLCGGKCCHQRLDRWKHRLANWSPLSSVQHNPWCPMILFLPVLSDPILALTSLRRILMSHRGVWSNTPWSLSENSCLVGWTIAVCEGDLSALRVESCSDDTGTHSIKAFAADLLIIKVQSKPPALLLPMLCSQIHSICFHRCRVLWCHSSAFHLPLVWLYLWCTWYGHSRSQSVL